MSALLKEMAGRAAAELVADGDRVGLGTGSTAEHAIRRIGERIRSENLRVTGIPTSRAAEALAIACGIPLATFDETARLDLAIDGADEVDGNLSLVKGGGGALLREKVVAWRARRRVIVVDPSKLVARLGVRFPLPVEVVPFAARPVADGVRALGGEPLLRRTPDAGPFVTDNGNWILDIRFENGIDDPAGLERALDAIPGLVESGLFVALVDEVIVGRNEGPERRLAAGAPDR